MWNFGDSASLVQGWPAGHKDHGGFTVQPQENHHGLAWEGQPCAPGKALGNVQWIALTTGLIHPYQRKNIKMKMGGRSLCLCRIKRRLLKLDKSKIIQITPQ
jgi:hypothetical protein